MIVVFDLDGTLIDSHNLHAHILTKILMDYGVTRKIERIDLSSTSLKLFLMKILPPGLWKDMDEICARYMGEFSKNAHKISLMPGAIEALEQVREKKAVFTAMPRKVAETALKAAGIKRYFEVVVTGDDVERTKPDPEGLMLIAEELGDHRLVVVGNGENDIRAAKNFGAVSVFFSPKGETHRDADFNIKDLRELPALVENIRLSNRRFFKL